MSSLDLLLSSEIQISGPPLAIRQSLFSPYSLSVVKGVSQSTACSDLLLLLVEYCYWLILLLLVIVAESNRKLTVFSHARQKSFMDMLALMNWLMPQNMQIFLENLSAFKTFQRLTLEFSPKTRIKPRINLLWWSYLMHHFYKLIKVVSWQSRTLFKIAKVSSCTFTHVIQTMFNLSDNPNVI